MSLIRGSIRWCWLVVWCSNAGVGDVVASESELMLWKSAAGTSAAASSGGVATAGRGCGASGVVVTLRGDALTGSGRWLVVSCVLGVEILGFREFARPVGVVG